MNLEDIIKGRVLIVGIGNRQRSDDGIGPVLIDELKKAGFLNTLDAGTVPENYTKNVIEFAPDTIILIDALSFGGKPGEFRIISPEQFDEFGFSTHNSSLKLFSIYVTQSIATKIYLLGIQPASIALREALSPELKQTLSQLTQAFVAALK